MVKVTYKKLEKMLEKITNTNRVPFIWGPPGIGKSTIAKNVANTLGYDLKVLDAPLFEPTDYLIPSIDKESGTVKYYTHEIFLQPNTVILIDDLPHAKPYQMIPLFQLVLDRRIGNIKLPDTVKFIVTGNREEDFAEVNNIPTPLLNRFVHFELQPDVDEWLDWAVSTDVHDYVVGFIHSYRSEFLHLPKEGVRAWPTPRSWHMLSDLLHIDEENIFEYAIATVGEQTGSLFTSFVKLFRSIDPVKIVEKGFIEDIKGDKQKQFATIISVAQYLSKKSPKYIKSFGKNIEKFASNLIGENKLLFARAVHLYSNKNKDIVIALGEVTPTIFSELKRIIMRPE